MRKAKLARRPHRHQALKVLVQRKIPVQIKAAACLTARQIRTIRGKIGLPVRLNHIQPVHCAAQNDDHQPRVPRGRGEGDRGYKRTGRQRTTKRRATNQKPATRKRGGICHIRLLTTVKFGRGQNKRDAFGFAFSRPDQPRQLCICGICQGGVGQSRRVKTGPQFLRND